MNRLLLLTLLFVFTSGSAFAAPDLDLRTLEGKAASLDDYVGKGKWTLVMFWATDCGICMREKPVMSDFHDAHKDKDAIVVGVAIDGMANVASVRDR
ncbi:MAG: peroxiredoxin family protein, partial [Thiotrichales bacterium]